MTRTYYSNTSIGVSSTTSTSYQDKVTLTFTPTSGKKYAIFLSALISNNNTGDKTFIRILDDTNTATLYEASIEPHDTTDIFSVTGIGMFTAASSSSHTFKVQYDTTSGGTASIQDVYLTALELVDTDVVDSTTGTFSVSGGSGGVDGDDEYDTLNQITVPAGNYFIIGSCSYKSSETNTSNVERTRIHIWDDTNNNSYGYIGSSYLKDTNQYQPYWYVMGVSPNSTTNYDFRAGEDYDAEISVQYRTILALDRDAVRQAYSAHAENIQNSTSLSDTVADSITVSLDNSGNNLILSSWFGANEDTGTSWLSNIQLNGTDIYSSDISVEPNEGAGTPTFDGIENSNWCCGFAGIQNMSSGNNTVRVVWRTEDVTDTASIARVNVSGIDVDGDLGLQWYTKNGGAWKQAENFYVKSGGAWKAATGLYVKNNGVWKSLIAEPEFTGENVDATSSEYTNVFPDVPPPPPGGVTCVGAGTLITMWDNTKKAIQDIIPGDTVKTLTGVMGTVLNNKPVPLSPARRMMNLEHPDGRILRFSDDHDLWVNINGVEQWGVYNYNWWLYEAIHYNEEECPAKPLIWNNKTYKFATDYGWLNTVANWEVTQDPNEIIWGIKIDQGGGYIADGFVIISEGCTSKDIENVHWQGLI